MWEDMWKEAKEINERTIRSVKRTAKIMTILYAAITILNAIVFIIYQNPLNVIAAVLLVGLIALTRYDMKKNLASLDVDREFLQRVSDYEKFTREGQ